MELWVQGASPAVKRPPLLIKLHDSAADLQLSPSKLQIKQVSDNWTERNEI